MASYIKGAVLKRIGYLYEKAFSKENIRKAIHEACKGKRKRKIVAKVLANEDDYVDKIYEMMLNDEFEPSEYIHEVIKDGVSKKERLLSKPKFYPDHIVCWCIYLVLEPILKKSLIKNTFASLKGRGQMYGLKKCKKKIKGKKGRYYFKSDIRKFYPSVNIQKLMKMLERKIKDKRFLSLIKKILSVEEGLPIGMILSQLFANFYLSEIDHKYEKYGYVRYADDIVIFTNKPESISRVRFELENDLFALGLTIKPSWTIRMTKKCPLDFMGFKIYRDHVTIRKTTMYRITRRVSKWIKNNSLKNAYAITSYMGWVKNTNSYLFYEDEISPFVDFKILKDIIRNGGKKNENLCFGI